MIRETKVPSIPDIRDDNVKEVLRAIKATLDVREGSIGDPLDQSVTLRDLVDLNVAQANGTTDTASGGYLPVTPVMPPIDGGYSPSTDYTTPAQPTGLRAKGGFTNVFLEWDGAPYRNHSFAEIWRSETDNLGTALMVGTTAANVYADAANPDTLYFYWIRFVSVANVTGPYNQTSGTQAQTAIDVSAALSAISEDIQGSQLFADLGTRIQTIETSQLLNLSALSELQSGRALLSSELSRTGSAVLSVQKVSSEQASILTALGTRVGDSESSILTLQQTTATQATSFTQLNTRVGTAESNITNLQTTTANQAAQVSALSTSIDTKSKVFFKATAPASTAGYTLATGDVWYDTDDSNKSYRWSGSAWVAYVNSSKVYYQAAAPIDSASSPLFAGDLWYDSDENNRPYRWSGSAWASMRDGYIDARVTTLEQTKIGYATLNSTGLVFDNNGAITDATSTAAWNTANPANQATWRVGLPFATAVKQVSVSDGNSSLTLEQRFTAQKGTNDALFGQYTVKIDNNGHVSGFGLASGAVNGTPTSAFIVRADRFAIAGVDDTSDPLGTLAPTRQPFVVTTTPTTINGKTYPAGTWIDTAFIANATIGTAQITDLTADKITTGNLTATIGITTGKIQGGVAGYNSGTGFFLGLDSSVYKFYVGSSSQNMRWDGADLSVTGNINATSGTFHNITIYDASNNVILSSGGVPASSVTGLGTLATQSSVTTGQVSGLGTLATLSSVGSAQISEGAVGITQLGTTIQSTNYSATTGWRITKAGEATFNSVSLRGDISGGSYVGYAWPASGGGFHLGPNGLLLGNYNTGKFFQVEAAGNVYAPGFSIVDGNAIFYGNLSGASGTFSGSLTAQVINTTNIVGAAVTSGFSSSTSGLTTSVTVSVPAGASSVIVIAYLGAPYTVNVGSGEDAYSFVATPAGTLNLDGSPQTTQSGTLVFSYGPPGAGTYTLSITRDRASGVMNMSVLVNKR